MNFEQLLPLLITLIGSAGLWGFLTLKAKQAYEKSLRSTDDHAKFNETLRKQVESLGAKVDKLVMEKEELLKAIADLRAELAASRTTSQHLENMMRMRP